MSRNRIRVRRSVDDWRVAQVKDMPREVDIRTYLVQNGQRLRIENDILRFPSPLRESARFVDLKGGAPHGCGFGSQRCPWLAHRIHRDCTC